MTRDLEHGNVRRDCVTEGGSWKYPNLPDYKPDLHKCPLKAEVEESQLPCPGLGEES